MPGQKRYVLTGGPSVGKTTVSQILASRGYVVVPEAARLIIEEQLALGTDILPWKDAEMFQNLLAQKQLELDAQFTQPEIFLDRSLLDGLAFCRFYKVPVPPEITEEAIGAFDKIFLLDRLPQYSTDPGRVLTASDSAEIHDILEDEYRKRGFEIVNVPALAPEERADFIIRTIEGK